MITRELLKTLRSEMESALLAIGNKHNVSLTVGNATFTATQAKFKLEVVPKGPAGEVVDKDEAYLKANFVMLGLTESNLTQVFVLDGKRFKLHGYRTSAHAKPYIIKDVDNGKNYIASHAQVWAALGNQFTPLVGDIKEKFLVLASRLSPENLSADGELPAHEVKRRHTQIINERRALEREFGRTVIESELYT